MSAIQTPLTPQKQDQNTKWYLDLLQDGFTIERPDVGRWLPLVEQLEDVCDKSNGNRAFVYQATVNSLIASQKYPGLKEMLSGEEVQAKKKEENIDLISLVSIPPLPDSLLFPSELARNASPTLNTYAQYSELVSPEGYRDFHEDCGLWMFSTIAGRRVKIPFNRRQYTPLMILLVARGGLYIKSDTAEVAIDVLKSAGLYWMLGNDQTTPEKLMSDMAGTLPKNYADLSADQQYQLQKRFAMSAQRGWFYDEFGELVKAMSKEMGVMQNFKGLLLKLDKCSDQYSYSTETRGTELIEKPYLALLGCLTPPDLKNMARAGADFWANGLWDRVSFSVPPPGSALNKPFGLGEIPVPMRLSRALRDWHERLGIPGCSIDSVKNEKGKITHWEVNKEELPETTITPLQEVYEAWVNYRSALKDIAKDLPTEDLDGSYSRLPIKAIRVAALLASVENAEKIELCHWAKAQEIAERWRSSLHQLYYQINSKQNEPTQAKKVEDELIRIINKFEEQGKPAPTIRDFGRYLRNVDAGKIKLTVTDMVRSEILIEQKDGKAKRYSLNEEDG